MKADRTRLWLGQNGGAHASSARAWDQEGGPDVCADDGGLRTHAVVQPGANPSAGAEVKAIGPENRGLQLKAPGFMD